MQSLPLVSVDMMSARPPSSTSTARRGADDIFAPHLAAASREHASTAPQAKRLAKQERRASSDDDAKKDASADNNPTSGATLNSSAGAANVATAPVNGTTATNQSLTEVPPSESPVLQELNTIITAPGLMGVAQISGLTGAAQTSNPAQTLSANEQSLLATTPATATPDNSSGIAAPAAGSGQNGITPIVNTALQPQITVSLASGTAPAAGTAGKTEQTTAVVPSVPDQTQAAAPPTIAQQDPTPQGGDQIVQNQYGQIITIEGSKPLTAAPNNQNPDVTNNSIHAHLPLDVPQAVEKGNGNFQQEQDTAKENPQKGTNTTKTIANANGPFQPDQPLAQNPQAPVGPENQPLIFPHQQASTPPVGNTPPADSPTQLPSGLTVPAGTVVDQMIDHFSGNKRLESGIVNLKLNPQELGELRMEIKITQDNIKAHIIAQNPQAQEMINLHLPRLREALEQQGLHLQQVEVTLAANDNASREQFRGNSGQQQLNQSMQTKGSQPILTLDTGEGTEEALQALNNLSVLA